MMFNLPWARLSLVAGPFHLDVGIPLPIGFVRLSQNLGYVGIGFAALSWDFRK